MRVLPLRVSWEDAQSLMLITYCSHTYCSRSSNWARPCTNHLDSLLDSGDRIPCTEEEGAVEDIVKGAQFFPNRSRAGRAYRYTSIRIKSSDMKSLVLLIACFSVARATEALEKELKPLKPRISLGHFEPQGPIEFVVFSVDDYCKERDAGCYVDLKDCSKYYQCDDFHKTHHRTCSEQLKWSAVKNICDHAADVDCDRKPLKPHVPLLAPAPYPGCDLHCQEKGLDGSCTVMPNWRIEKGMCVDNNYCLLLPNGHYHDPRNCSRFYQCDAFHKAFLHSCPSGLKWSVTKTTCDWPRYVDCDIGGAYKPPFRCNLRDPIPKKIGCLKGWENGHRLIWNELLFTDRDPSSNVFSGILIDWANWQDYINSLACRCARAAYKKGYTYFGLQFYGECWSGPYSGRLGPFTTPDNCVQNYFQECEQDNTEFACVGKAWFNYVYRALPPYMMK
ncbi:predicted protein [Nematostella vectensis]|uniref:Chitin-binding type-2 domain-containing protein n=1 Tax=Nematostella vectensis TaxID=45351 RepID=A7SN03_NEMVE|nr:predicted protein [Nematostella vectensis]|eukprot:XP_001627021.1 predicted protein [Nematostella vectensis]